MSQVLHIFRKDLRHHWIEAFVAQVLLIAFVADQPRQWAHRPAESRFLEFASKAVPFLLVIGWIFLVIRLVQEESLVGDRQFWITRPYEWHQLLGAKLLFILVMFHIPLFLAQSTLLGLGRFNVLPSLGSLLILQLMFFLVLTVPTMAVSSLTSVLWQTIVVALGVCLLLIGTASLTTILPDAGFSTDAYDTEQMFITFGTCLGIIGVQYVVRRPKWSWIMAGIGSSCVILLVVASTYGNVIARQFPLLQANKTPPVRFDFDSTLAFSGEDRVPEGNSREYVILELPILVSDIEENSVVEVRGIKVDLESEKDKHWSSQWTTSYTVLLPGRKRFWPTILIKKRDFDRFDGKSASGKISLALNIYRIEKPEIVRTTNGEFTFQGNTRCYTSISSHVQCIAPMRESHPILVTADLPSATCPSKEMEASESVSTPFYANVGSEEGPDFALSPVREFSINLSKMKPMEDISSSVEICSGTALQVSKLTFTSSLREEIAVQSFELVNYVPGYPKVLRSIQMR